MPYVPIKGTTVEPLPEPPVQRGGGTSGTQRKLGTFRFNIKIKKVSGKKGKKSAVTVTFTDSSKKKVGSVKVKKSAAKKATVAVRGVAETGTYKWTAKIGKKTVKRGTIKVGSKSGLQLSAGAKLAVTAK